jgi:hypothetical protein
MKLKIGIAIVIVGLIGAVAMRSSGPWRALRARYPGPTPEHLQELGRGTVELRSAGQAGVVVHSESIQSDLGATAVSLGMRSPMGLFLRPIQIPAVAVSTCERRKMSGQSAGIELWVRDVGIGVGFPLLDESTVLTWCREHGIQVLGDPKTP